MIAATAHDNTDGLVEILHLLPEESRGIAVAKGVVAPATDRAVVSTGVAGGDDHSSAAEAAEPTARLVCLAIVVLQGQVEARARDGREAEGGFDGGVFPVAAHADARLLESGLCGELSDLFRGQVAHDKVDFFECWRGQKDA